MGWVVGTQAAALPPPAAAFAPRSGQPQCATPLVCMAPPQASRTCSCPLPLRGCALLKAATAGRLPAKAEDLHCSTKGGVTIQDAGSPAPEPWQQPHAPARKLPRAAAHRRLHG